MAAALGLTHWSHCLQLPRLRPEVPALWHSSICDIPQLCTSRRKFWDLTLEQSAEWYQQLWDFILTHSLIDSLLAPLPPPGYVLPVPASCRRSACWVNVSNVSSQVLIGKHRKTMGESKPMKASPKHPTVKVLFKLTYHTVALVSSLWRSWRRQERPSSSADKQSLESRHACDFHSFEAFHGPASVPVSPPQLLLAAAGVVARHLSRAHQEAICSAAYWWRLPQDGKSGCKSTQSQAPKAPTCSPPRPACGERRHFLISTHCQVPWLFSSCRRFPLWETTINSPSGRKTRQTSSSMAWGVQTQRKPMETPTFGLRYCQPIHGK